LPVCEVLLRLADVIRALEADAVSIQETLSELGAGAARPVGHVVRLQAIDRMTQSLADVARAVTSLASRVPRRVSVPLSELDGVLRLGTLRSHVGTGRRETEAAAGEVHWL
jgi:uncharacterized protein with PhoU and TrkA domain